MLRSHWATAESLGLIEDGMLDTTRIKACLDSGMKEAGEVVLMGFKFKPNDVTELMEYLDA